MKIEQVIKHFGSQVILADAIGVSQPCVSNWRKRGVIPHLQQIRIEHITKGKLKALPLMPKKNSITRVK
jgi:DNA-binding transcriptional regulator YdaS (Cro superfamily)